MIEAIVFSALIFTVAACILRGTYWLWREALPVIRQYQITKRVPE